VLVLLVNYISKSLVKEVCVCVGGGGTKL